MLTEDKETFKDFTESDEAVATNILSTKLKNLEEWGVIIKTKRPNNKKTNLYLLTEKGLALAPVLVELAYWSDQNLRDVHPTIVNGERMKKLRNDKVGMTNFLVQKYREKLADMEYIR